MTKDALHTWQRVATEVVYACRIFSLRRDRARFSRDEAEHDFHVIESADWVNIVPITAGGDVVLVRQFRHGIRDCTLEIPGGMVDPGEEPLVAARREMVEESGYDSARVEALGTIHPNPAIQNNRCHSFVAFDVEHRHVPAFDSTEETEVVLVPLARIPELIRAGEITHALVVVAFHWLALRPAAAIGV
jgi:8-oxo-dGTP pyrophosphatase MutT (NUDIX family)